MIRLVQEFGAQAGRQLPFDKARIRVGRAPDNDVVFDANVDLDASGRHCEILQVDGAWHVVDAGSRNGTFVNGVRVQRQQLKHNDVIECGRGGPRLRIETGSIAPPQPVPGSSTAPSGSPPAAVAMPAFVAPLPASFPPSAPPPPAPFAAPPPANPFGAPAAVASTPPAGGGSGTVAIPQMAVPGAVAPPPGAAPGGPPVVMHAPAGPSVGQAMAASLPAHAQVGKRTVAMMIDQALAAREQRSGRGLKIMVGALTVLVLASLGAAAWFVWDYDNSHRGTESRPVGGGDPSNTGARIAAANEGNIYLLAMRQADGRVRGFCTGFSVNENTLATNAHCVRVATQEIARNAQLVALRNKGNGEMIPARPVYLDARFQDTSASRGGAGYDVGLVQTDARLPGWVALAPDAELYALREGDAVFVYGFPGMTMNERSPVATITLGLLNRVTDFFDGVATPPTAQKLQHSAQTAGGSSGSPIFLPSGSVIGVNAGSLSDDERQVVVDPSNGQRREVEVNRGSNFKYGMRADLIRQAMASVSARIP